MKVLLIIPAYNEEDCILQTCLNIDNYNKKSEDIKLDYVVINDGSKDLTESILCENNINHIQLIQNLGIGGAVQTGYKYAFENNYDVAVQYDGDGQHDVAYVKDLIDSLEKNKSNMAIGSRFIDKSSSKFKSSASRRIGINIISFVIKMVTKKKIYDCTSGFRAVDRELIKYFAKYYPAEYPEPITEVEILKKGYKISEVPVSMNERQGGKSSISSWKNAYYMVNVILSIFVTGGNNNE